LVRPAPDNDKSGCGEYVGHLGRAVALLIEHGHSEQQIIYEYSYAKILMYTEAIDLNKQDRLKGEFYNIRVATVADEKGCKQYLALFDRKQESKKKLTEDEARLSFVKRLQQKAKK
jgi:hypothetical protein